MNTSTVLLIVIGASAFLIGLNGALECYQCTTADDGAGCGDANGFDRGMPVSAKAEIKNLFGEGFGEFGDCEYCSKSKVVADGIEIVLRSCIPFGGIGAEVQCTKWDYLGNEGEMCMCTGDRCNSSTESLASISLLAGAVFISLLGQKMW